MSTAEVEAALDEMRRLDAELENIFPDGSTLPQDFAGASVTELFVLARRSYRSAYVLMSETVGGQADHTENAAVLVRRVLELYAQVIFITEQAGDPQAGALRTLLSDLLEQLTAFRDVHKLRQTEEWAERIKLQHAMIDEVKARLRNLGYAAKNRPNLYDILKSVSPEHAVRWRYESDIAHGRLIGRAMQRSVGDDGIVPGVRSPDAWQVEVVDFAISYMADTTVLWGRLIGADLTNLEAFIAGRRASR